MESTEKGKGTEEKNGETAQLGKTDCLKVGQGIGKDDTIGKVEFGYERGTINGTIGKGHAQV